MVNFVGKILYLIHHKETKYNVETKPKHWMPLFDEFCCPYPEWHLRWSCDDLRTADAFAFDWSLTNNKSTQSRVVKVETIYFLFLRFVEKTVVRSYNLE